LIFRAAKADYPVTPQTTGQRQIVAPLAVTYPGKSILTNAFQIFGRKHHEGFTVKHVSFAADKTVIRFDIESQDGVTLVLGVALEDEDVNDISDDLVWSAQILTSEPLPINVVLPDFPDEEMRDFRDLLFPGDRP